MYMYVYVYYVCMCLHMIYTYKHIYIYHNYHTYICVYISTYIRRPLWGQSGVWSYGCNPKFTGLCRFRITWLLVLGTWFLLLGA